ncbi:MAG: pilus assembly protein TadG-related protein [Thermoguttaceae bacterium]
MLGIGVDRHGIRRRGTVLVLVTVSLVAILGVLALVLDGGLLRDDHRRVQGACDAAALAAATELFINYPAIVASGYSDVDPGGKAAAAALASAAANGYSSGEGQAVVAVDIPPSSGPFVGRAGYVEVRITCRQQRVFSQVFGSGALPVTGRAVARGRWGGSGIGIIVLDPVAKSSLNASGSGGVTVRGGAGVIVDSNSGEAAVVTGGGGITAADFEITGSYAGVLNGSVTTGVPASPDPLRYLPEPPAPPNGQMTVTNLGTGSKRYTLTPGRYTTLPNFQSGDEVVLQQASANGAGGIYYIDGGGLKSTGATITMDPNTSGGVMIYNHPTSGANSGQIQITGNSSGRVNLSSLTEGPYAGMLFWQDRAAAQPMSISGGGDFTLSGTFYAANATLQITGNGTATIGSQYVSRTLNLGGNGNVLINYSDGGTARIREATLVE